MKICGNQQRPFAALCDQTAKLAADRAEKANKIQAATARAAAERKAREAQEALAKAEELEARLTQEPEGKT